MSGRSPKKLYQSFLAQLETGKFQNVTPDLLSVIADTYRETLPEVFKEYASRRYGIDVLQYAQAKFGLADSPAKIALLEQEILDIDGLAQWEANIPADGELWVVTVKLLDDRNEKIREAIFKLLKKRCQIIYFAAEPKDYTRLQRHLISIWEETHDNTDPTDFAALVTDNMDFVELTDAEIAFMTSSIVIAQPREIFKSGADADVAQAYLVFGDGLAPDYGLRVRDREALRDLVTRLRERHKQKNSDHPKT